MTDKTERLLHPKNWINPETGRRYMYFSKDGHGYDDTLTWAKHFEDRKNKIIKQENTCFGLFWVSTVWLGLDHSLSPTQPPLVFESMVFSRLKRSYNDFDSNKYTTEKQALAGHTELVRKWNNPFFVFWYYNNKYKLAKYGREHFSKIAKGWIKGRKRKV